MDVYLVPASPTRNALYCEVSASAAAGTDVPATFWGRMVARFRAAVDEGEAAQDAGAADQPERSRLRQFITRKLAETVAEQRLLWHLRHETSAHLWHADAIDGAAALASARADFTVDYARHRRWLFIDGLITAITGPLFFFIPGPNIVSWYFTFRAVGHFFSMRGAARALSGVTWTPVPTPHLTTVAQALPLDGDTRKARVADAAQALGLDRLAAFVDRVADQPA
jgi:hypothetical protein